MHVAGIDIDIVRTGEDDFYVLEDNLRTPSGVSYMLENRVIMMRLFPELFAQNRIAPVDHYRRNCSTRCAPRRRPPTPRWWC